MKINEYINSNVHIEKVYNEDKTEFFYGIKIFPMIINLKPGKESVKLVENAFKDLAKNIKKNIKP